jgi:hydroxypyruvate isomerase
MIYPNLRLERRIREVALLGFDSIDIWDWRDKDLGELRTQLRENQVRLNSFGGHRDSSPTIAGERGEFMEELRKSFEVAHTLECSSLMVFSDGLMASVPGSDPPVAPAKQNNATAPEKFSNMCESLERAADLAEREDVTLLLESLNNMDHPNYFLNSSRLAIDAVTKVRSGRLKMLFDIYHMQVAEGNITATLLKNLGLVGYIHFADVPGRHEPGTGELNLLFILKKLTEADYKGGVGFEFVPLANDRDAIVETRKQLGSFLRVARSSAFGAV